MRKLFNKEQEEYILSNYLTMKYKDIANNLGGFTTNQIVGWLNNNGYKKGHKSIFSKEDIEYMKNNHLNKTYKEIANHIRFSERQVRSWVNNNCPTKLRKFDKDYFFEINNSNKSYWLGFIYADGWIVNNPEKRNYELGIELRDIDEEHLIDFNNELGGCHKIIHKHSEKYICNYENISITNSVCIRIYSKKIVSDLMKHGVLQNKTYKSNFPMVSDDLFFDFLRGYIDGDGCIYVNEENLKSSSVSITSANRKILEYIKQKLSIYDIASYIYKEKECKYRLYVPYKYSLKLLDLLYYNENVQKLNRKYKKYLLLKALSVRNN